MTVSRDGEGRGVREVLATVAGNVAAVPIVVGFVALGGAVVATRAMFRIRHAFRPRDGRRRRRRSTISSRRAAARDGRVDAASTHSDGRDDLGEPD